MYVFLEKKKTIVFVISLLLILSLVACGTNENNENSSSKEEEILEEGSTYKDTLIYAMNTDALTLDLQQQKDATSRTVVNMLYNGLLKYVEDGQGGFKIVGDLADSWGVDDDGLTWTFNLKEGVKFHSGKEMTAHDFKATYERAIDPEAAFQVSSLTIISDIEVKDDYTLVLKTKEPVSNFESVLTDIETGVLDPEFIEKYGNDLGATVESVNGTGPYKVVEWIRDEEIVLERFDDYFEDKGKTKTIVYKVIPENSARAIALETGEIDITTKLLPEDVKRFDGMDGFKVIKRDMVNQRLFRFGCNDPIISNTKVRQAIVHAIDRKAIIDSLFPGLVGEVTGPLTKVSQGYIDLGVIKQDQDKARQLLVEAGYPDGFETKIVTTSRYEQGVELAEIISAQLAEVGIKADIEVLEWSVISPMWKTTPMAEFDQPMFIMGSGAPSADADSEWNNLYTAWDREDSRLNYGFYYNEEVDELMPKARAEMDETKRNEYYKRIGEILYLDDPAGIWLFDQYNIFVTSDEVDGITFYPSAVVTFENVTVKE